MTKIATKKNKKVVLSEPKEDIPEVNEETKILHEEELRDLRREENLVESQVQGYYDVFSIQPNDLFPETLIKTIVLPKFSFSHYGQIERSENLLIETYNEHSVAQNILKYAKQSGFDISISILSINNETAEETTSIWKFKNARIASVDYGSLASTIRENYRTIVCEISFHELEIDGISIKLP